MSISDVEHDVNQADFEAFGFTFDSGYLHSLRGFAVDAPTAAHDYQHQNTLVSQKMTDCTSDKPPRSYRGRKRQSQLCTRGLIYSDSGPSLLVLLQVHANDPQLADITISKLVAGRGPCDNRA